jgi:hypothetical protein
LKKYLFATEDGTKTYGFFYANSDEEAQRICDQYNAGIKTMRHPDPPAVVFKQLEK